MYCFPGLEGVEVREAGDGEIAAVVDGLSWAFYAKMVLGLCLSEESSLASLWIGVLLTSDCLCLFEL